MAGMPFSPFLFENTHRYWIIEPPRAGASRIKEPRIANSFVMRQVAMPEHNDVGWLARQRSGHRRAHAVRTVENMGQVEAQSSQHDPGFLPRIPTLKSVDIPGHGRNRRDFPQPGEHRNTA